MSGEQDWTVLRLLRWTTEFFESRRVLPARRQAEDLLGHALELDRLHLYLQFEYAPSASELALFRGLVQRRGRGEPLQYLLGWQPFLGLRIGTDRRALIPRPETEALAEKAVAWLKSLGAPAAAADVGTGSGCLALALAALAGARVFATDISAEALQLARENASALGLDPAPVFLEGPLFEPLRREGLGGLDLLVSNPPYVALGEKAGLPAEVRDWEPASALFAGPEGLDVLVPLLEGAAEFLRPGGRLALECGLGQAEKLEKLAGGRAGFRSAWTEKDPQGRVRYLWAEKA